VFLAGKFLSVPLDTFLSDVSFSHKTHRKKREREFLRYRQPHA